MDWLGIIKRKIGNEILENERDSLGWMILGGNSGVFMDINQQLRKNEASWKERIGEKRKFKVERQ